RLERADSLWNEDRDQGLAMVQELHQAMPQNLPVAETLINMNLLLGRTDRAKTVLEKMVTAHPDNENLKFQRQLFDASPERRVKMRLEQVDKIADPLRRALTRARIHGQVGNREEYVRSLEEAAKINPDAPVVIQMQFRNALARKDWELVRTAVARAKTGDENYGRILEAQALLAQNKYHQTVDVLTPARKEYPDSKIILRLLGRAYLFLKDIDQAAEVYGVLESNDPGDFDALKGLAVVAEMRGEKERNERFVVRAYRNPAGKRDHYIRMRHLEIEEKYAKGDEIRKIIDERERLLKQRPNNLDNVEHLAGMYELRTKEFDKSEKMYRYGFEKSGQSLRWARALAFFYARIGQSTKGDTLLQNGVRQTKDKAQKVSWLVLQGDYLMLYDAKQAYNAYSQAISTDPSNPIGHRALAGMHERQGNWSKAAVAMVNYLAIAREDTRGQKTLIRYLIYAGEYDKAGKEIAAILDKTPADAKTLMLKGALHVARGEAGKALPPLSQALEKNRNYVSALIIRSRAYHILGEMGRARADLERARGQSNAPDVVMELVNLYVRLDDLDSAQLSLQGIMSRIPTYQPAVRRLINLCIMRKKWPKMERELRKAKKLFPKEPYYWLTEAEMWRQRNRLDKAIGALGKAFALVPGSPDVLREYLLGLAIAKQYDTLLTVSKPYETRPGWGEWIKALRARAMAGKGRTEDAEDLFILAVTHARTRELGFIVNQIRATYGTGPAVAKLEAWARRRPGDWLMQVLLGDLYIRVANVPEGSLSPEQVKVYRAKAISAYQAALGMAKGTNQTGPINYRLGSAYHLDGKYSQAEQAYLACLKVSPDNYGALNDLAYLYVNETDQPDKGLPYAQKVVKFRPRDATILDTYGWVLAKMEKYDQASKVLEQSIEREPAMPASRYHLGWVHEQTGRMREAKKQYRLGIELVSQKKGDRLYKVLQKAWKRVGGK
ncbi:MAG: tetratricopeptide repeat protein, partial [Phycisphaerae bacterium]|nr:tetratricopeptide repeat protein [Phycisphaerae bacterium]